MFWLIICEFIQDIILDQDFKAHTSEEEMIAKYDYDKDFAGNFLTEYGFPHISHEK